MNIFLISDDPKQCAEALCDLRLNKMILETTQLACTVYPSYWPALAKQYEDTLYKPTHPGHPCTTWLRRHKNNYAWLILYLHALHAEYTYRRNRVHKSRELLPILTGPVSFLLEDYLNNKKDPAYFAAVMDVKFSFNCSNIHPLTGSLYEDYKICLSFKWHNDARDPKWTLRHKPDWVYNFEKLKDYSYLN